MSSAEAILGLKTGAEGLVDAVRLGLPIKSFTLVAEYTALSRQQLAAAAGSRCVQCSGGLRGYGPTSPIASRAWHESTRWPKPC